MSLHFTEDDETEIAEINTTPLIDVMLVLLVMLIITIPLQTHAVKLALPDAPPSQTAPPPSLLVQIGPEGKIVWAGEALDGIPAMEARMQAVAAMTDPPELRLTASADAPYDRVAAVMAAAQRDGLRKIGLQGSP